VKGIELPGDLLWEDWLRFHLERKEAYALVTGKAPPANPWWHLYQWRLCLALAQAEKADAEFEVAVAVSPNDPAIWLARSHLYEEPGQADRAKSDLTKAVALNSSDARPWIVHGHFLAERGRHAEADEAFARAASAAPRELYRFVQAGWWIVGPFPGQLDVPTRVETDADPSTPIGQARWQHVVPDACGRVDLSGGPEFPQ